MLYVQDPFFLRRPRRPLMPLCLLIMVLMVSGEITQARLASVYNSSRCVSLDGLSMPCICHPVNIALGNANRFKIHGQSIVFRPWCRECRAGKRVFDGLLIVRLQLAKSW
jgi:hypothetical protein